MENLGNESNQYAVGLKDWLFAHQVRFGVDELDKNNNNLATISVWQENGNIIVENQHSTLRRDANGRMAEEHRDRFAGKEYPIKLLVPYNISGFHFELAEITLQDRNTATNVIIYNKYDADNYSNLSYIISSKLSINQMPNAPSQVYNADDANIIGSADGRCGDAVIAIARLRAANLPATYNDLPELYPGIQQHDPSNKGRTFDQIRQKHYVENLVPDPLAGNQISNEKPNNTEKKEPKPEPKNPFAGKGKFEIEATYSSGDPKNNSSSPSKTKDKKLHGKLPSVRHNGDNANPEEELDQVRWLVKKLYNDKGLGAEINKMIDNITDTDTSNKEMIAGLHALCEDLKKVHVAKYKGNNLLRELKEAQLAEDDPKSFGKGLNTLIKNRRMGVDENIGVDSISPLKLISGWNKRGWKEASLSGGTKEERDFLTNNTIHRVITAPIPAQEKRLIKNMLEASNREADYYENSIKNLIEHGLVLDEKTFEISKPLTLAKEIIHNVGDALNWVGQGIFAPPTRPEETRTWQKHAEYRNKLLQNYYKNLNPDRDGAFRIKYRELLQQGFSNSFYNQLLNEEEFNKMVEIVKKYADEQETEKFRNLDQLEKNLTDANEKILGKAEEIALKEDEIWKYKMLQMVIAFSPLAPLNVLNHIGDIIAPIKDFLDLFGVDTVIDWLLHDSPLKFVTETFDFAKDSVSPILNSASNLSDSPIAGLIIDGVAGLVLTDKWTELSILKKQANEESKKLNKNHLKTANESVEKYENSKITEYAKKVVSTLDGIIKKRCGGNEEEIKNAYFKRAKELGIPHNNLVRELQSEGFKEDDVSIYNLVKEHCTRTGANFQSLYGPTAKKGSIDIATSSSNENSPKKPITANDFSEEEKDKIRERAKELKEIYSQQEDRDIEQIQRYIEKYVKDRFNRSGTSRPAPDPDKNLLKLTDDTVPKPYDIKSRSDEEKFKSAKTLLEQATNTKKLVGGDSMMA